MRIINSLIAAAAAITCGAGQAQEYEEGHPIPEIIVTADPLSSVDTHYAKPVDVISGEEMKRRDVRNIGELVSREPGVSTSDFGAAVGRPVIRGMSGGRVRVLEDGIGTMDASTISADHAVTSEPLFANQVEIFRGPSTLLYGSGASGGLVNISTDRILDHVPESPEIRAVFQYDSVADGFTSAGGVSAGKSALALHAEGMFRDTDDYGIPGFSESIPDADASRGTLPNSDVETGAVSGGLSWIGERGFAGLSVSGLWDNYGIPGGHNHLEEEGVRIDMAQVRYDLQAALETPFPWIDEVRTRWGRNDYEHDEIEPDGAIGTHFSNDEWEGRVELIHAPIGDWDGVAGMQYRTRDFSATGEEAFVPSAEQESIAAFVFEKGDYGAWHLEAGGRYERNTSDDRRDGRQADFDLWNLSGAAGWEHADGFQLGLAVTWAQRAPSIEELFADGPHLATNTFEIGSPSLDTETSTNVDLYWHKLDGRVTFSINLFYNSVADFVYQRETDLNGDGAADRVEEDFSGDPSEIVDEEDALLLVNHVQDDAEFYGLEFESGANLFNDHRGDLHLRIWTDYVRGRIDGADDLPRITPWRFGAGLDYARGPWSATLDYMRVNRQDSTSPLEAATPGYDSLDVYAGYTFAFSGAELTAFVRGTNLFDEEMRRHTSFLKDHAPLPGRSALFGLRGTF
ncbi:MAG TPA: TonB-dependent receptor [Gammaproteobacteria bacterium]|jgi:iron complex outermembrane receptor protein